MLSIRNILFLAPLVSSLTLSAFAQRQPEPSKDTDRLEGIHNFRDLLNALPAESLHAALEGHLRPKYQDGVFEGDQRAMEAVHNDNPPLATRLMEIAKADVVAKMDLRKRQNNGTVSTSSPVVVVDQSTTAVSLTAVPATTSAI
ncbi:hypothetical protein LTR16_010714, partial [Cryomyces antarcticus]